MQDRPKQQDGTSVARPIRPYIPQDQLTNSRPDFALAADLIELTAFLAPDNRALVSDLLSALEIGQDEYENLDEALQTRDRISSGTSIELETRSRQLAAAYPFALDTAGVVLTFTLSKSWGRTLYLLSLILSHITSTRSPVLVQSGLLPTEQEIAKLRTWFQYCVTAGVAGEIGGDAWAFGWPRPDGSAFLAKLKTIWAYLKDGDVRHEPLEGAPGKVKDDEVDVIAARIGCDGLHGFPIILGQVASGDNWRAKSLRGHTDEVFYPEWFSTTPASQTLVYHIIPFTVDGETIRRHTRRLGHLMHRVRLCYRAQEAQEALGRGAQMQIEGTATFTEVDRWLDQYRLRAQTGGHQVSQ